MQAAKREATGNTSPSQYFEMRRTSEVLRYINGISYFVLWLPQLPSSGPHADPQGPQPIPFCGADENSYLFIRRKKLGGEFLPADTGPYEHPYPFPLFRLVSLS